MAWPGSIQPWLGWPGFWLEARASKTLFVSTALSTPRMLRRGPTSLPSLPPPPSGDYTEDLVPPIAAQCLNGRPIALRTTLPTVTQDLLADPSLAAAAIPPLVYKPTSAMSSLDSSPPRAELDDLQARLALTGDFSDIESVTMANIGKQLTLVPRYS
ncbi:hypothetical protein DFH09DRAFT_1084490 [Mycena vulgaris]|nr:hypothetical protein DFH09DRAFT_1084490 [Mycena vulgaris]